MRNDLVRGNRNYREGDSVGTRCATFTFEISRSRYTLEMKIELLPSRNNFLVELEINACYKRANEIYVYGEIRRSIRNNFR